MKKILVLLAALATIMACNKQEAGQFQSTAVSTEANSNEAFDYSITLPVISGNKQLTAFNNQIRAAIEVERASLDAMAQENLGSDGFHQYQYYVDYALASSPVVNSTSLLLHIYQYTGGANGQESLKSFTFIDGKEVIWQTIFNDNAEFIVLSLINEELKRDRAKPANQRLYFSDAVVDSLDQLNWYFDNDNLVIAFPIVTIAPHSAGIVYMNFALDNLIKQDAIKDAFISNTYQPLIPKEDDINLGV